MSVDWPIVRLGDYCSKIGSGATPRGGASVYLDEGDVCLIRSQNIYNDGFKSDGLVYITEESADKLKNVIIEKNDILLNITGDSVARVCLAKEEYLPARVNQHVAIIRPDPREFDARFLRYFLVSPAMQSLLLTIAAVGATRNALTKNMIETLEVSKPPLDVQVAIADNLETLDNKIELNRQTNQTLEQIAQAIFKSWFVEFDPVRAKMAAKDEWVNRCQIAKVGGNDENAGAIFIERAAMAAISGKSEAELDQLQQQYPEQYQQLQATAALFPDNLFDSELGQTPEGWEVKTLSEIIKIIGGGTPKRSEAAYWNGTIPWFSVRDVPAESDIFVVDTTEKITEIGLRKSSTKLLPKGTTIITARGTVGKLALVATPMCMNQSCYGIQAGEGIGPYFNFFNLREAISTLQQNTHGAVFDTITTQTFESYSMAVAGKNLIQAFDERLKPLLKQIEIHIRENAVLTELRDTLLPKLLLGDVSIDTSEMEF